MGVAGPPGWRVERPELERQSSTLNAEILDRYLAVRSTIQPMPGEVTWSKADRRYIMPGADGPDSGMHIED